MTRLSGITPSGHGHVGNYLGAIRRWAREGEPDDLYFVSDLHGMTTPYHPQKLRGRTRELLAILIAWLLWLNHKLGDIERFPFEPGGDRPVAVGEAQNILLIGVDDPADQGGLFEDLSSDTWTPGKFRSDAIMVLHISGDRRSAQLVSIPRDSFVDGSWDATGLLLDRFEEVEATLQRLPYVTGWR